VDFEEGGMCTVNTISYAGDDLTICCNKKLEFELQYTIIDFANA
jgi:hypothetical protein